MSATQISADDNEFMRDRWVRIMCDYSADGVWHKDGSAGDADLLPIPQDLKDRIRAWQEEYEAHNASNDVVPLPMTFGQKGLAIARDVKAALPDWTVIYFDEAACVSGRDMPDRPRTEFEYEITLD